MASGFSFWRCFRYPGLDMGLFVGYSWFCLLSSVDRVVPLRAIMLSTSFFRGILRVLVKWLGFSSLHFVIKSSVSIISVSLFTVFVELLTCPPLTHGLTKNSHQHCVLYTIFSCTILKLLLNEKIG